MCAQRTIHPIECINDPFNILKSYQIFELQILHLIKELHVCVIYIQFPEQFTYIKSIAYFSRNAQRKLFKFSWPKFDPRKFKPLLSSPWKLEYRIQNTLLLLIRLPYIETFVIKLKKHKNSHHKQLHTYYNIHNKQQWDTVGTRTDWWPMDNFKN